MAAYFGPKRRWAGCLLLLAASTWPLAAVSATATPFPCVQQASGEPSKAADGKDNPSSSDQNTDIDDQVIHDVFDPLQRGMQELNLKRVQVVFDQDAMPGYTQFRDQLRSFFDRHETVNFRYQLLQVTSEKDHATAIAEIDMDAAPADESQVIQRRSVRMRFELKRDPAGWKVIGFSPSDFFAQ